MNSNVKWFEYKMDDAQVLTPIENVEELRIHGSPEKPFSIVKVTIRTSVAKLVFVKEHYSEEFARLTYGNILAALKHGDNIISFEGWEFEVEWENN